MPVSNLNYKRRKLTSLPQGTRFKLHPNDRNVLVKGFFIGSLNQYECFRFGDITRIKYLEPERLVFVRP